LSFTIPNTKRPSSHPQSKKFKSVPEQLSILHERLWCRSLGFIDLPV